MLSRLANTPTSTWKSMMVKAIVVMLSLALIAALMSSSSDVLAPNVKSRQLARLVETNAVSVSNDMTIDTGSGVYVAGPYKNTPVSPGPVKQFGFSPPVGEYITTLKITGGTVWITSLEGWYGYADSSSTAPAFTFGGLLSIPGWTETFECASPSYISRVVFRMLSCSTGHCHDQLIQFTAYCSDSAAMTNLRGSNAHQIGHVYGADATSTLYDVTFSGPLVSMSGLETAALWSTYGGLCGLTFFSQAPPASPPSSSPSSQPSSSPSNQPSSSPSVSPSGSPSGSPTSPPSAPVIPAVSAPKTFGDFRKILSTGDGGCALPGLGQFAVVKNTNISWDFYLDATCTQNESYIEIEGTALTLTQKFRLTPTDSRIVNRVRLNRHGYHYLEYLRMYLPQNTTMPNSESLYFLNPVVEASPSLKTLPDRAALQQMLYGGYCPPKMSIKWNHMSDPNRPMTVEYQKTFCMIKDSREFQVGGFDWLGGPANGWIVKYKQDYQTGVWSFLCGKLNMAQPNQYGPGHDIHVSTEWRRVGQVEVNGFTCLENAFKILY